MVPFDQNQPLSIDIVQLISYLDDNKFVSRLE